MTTPPPPTTTADTEQQAALAELLAGVETRAPAPTAPATRDSRGRFLKGNPGGPGVPKGRGLDLRALAERESEREGFDLAAAAWRVLRRLFVLAEGGDVAAAKELFTRIGMAEDAQAGAGVQIAVITGVDSDGAVTKGIALRVAPREGDTNP